MARDCRIRWGALWLDRANKISAVVPASVGGAASLMAAVHGKILFGTYCDFPVVFVLFVNGKAGSVSIAIRESVRAS